MKTSKSIHLEQPKSTFERLMQNPDFKAKFEVESREFALSEIVMQLMEEGHITARELAKTAKVPASVIQDIRSGNRANVTLQNLSQVLKVLGSRVLIQIGNDYLPLEG